jgi:hypothetical protein
MIHPTDTDVPLLIAALNDPVLAVREAAAGALSNTRDQSAHLMIRRMRSAGRERPQSRQEALAAMAVPDARGLGVPLYPGAAFLAFASDPDIGRFAFSSADALQKIVEFYTKAGGRAAVTGEELTHLYFGGSPDDPNGARRFAAETEAWAKEVLQGRRPEAEVRAQFQQRAARMTDLPLIRYADQEIYGAPTFIAFDPPSSDGAPRAIRYVAVFTDLALGRAGFELHVR